MDFELDEPLVMLKRMARKLADDVFRPLASRWDEHAEPPLANLRILAANGLAGVTIPEQYGGSGGTVVHAVAAIEEIAHACAVTAAMILGNCVTAEILLKFGSEAQRTRYLPPLARGEQLSCWAMTEPEAGSAATEMRTAARPDGDRYVLSGNKVFITRAAVASFFIIFARVGGVPGAKGITAFIVDRETPGLRLGAPDRHMGLRGGAGAEVILENCRVPRETMLLRPGEFGKLMRGLNQARVLNPAICLGIAQEALDLAVAHTQQRKQFGQPLADFQGVQWMLADMAMKLEAMRLLVYRAAGLIAADAPGAAHQAAIAKAFTTEAAFEVTNTALQLHGGYGYSKEFPLERMLRDVRAFQIGGGSTQILRNRIAASLLKRRADGSAGPA
jgi:alkylation response protein AidB-like acyl-CoA dehydrogenase